MPVSVSAPVSGLEQLPDEEEADEVDLSWGMTAGFRYSKWATKKKPGDMKIESWLVDGILISWVK